MDLSKVENGDLKKQNECAGRSFVAIDEISIGKIGNQKGSASARLFESRFEKNF